MAGMWHRAMVYLGLVDDEFDDFDDDYTDDDGDFLDDGTGDSGPERPRNPYESPRRAVEPRPDSGPTVRTLPRQGDSDPGEQGGEPRPAAEPVRPSTIRAVETTRSRVHVVEPHGFNDAQEVGDRLKAGQPVIINIQGLSRDLQRRLIDFSSGLAYAVEGSMSRVADQVFLLAPDNVEVSEEEKERLQARGLYRA
ncbi:MAG: cell division protein SepF [Acidimicrobiia bacterium]